MNSTKIISKTIIHFMMIAALIITVTACGEGNSSPATPSDSSMKTDNTMNSTANNMNGQTNATNDTSAAGTGSTSNTGSNNGTTENSGEMDTAFIMKAAEINMEEIKLGKLAQQKGSMGHVKELGNMMVAEHTQAMADLKTLARSKMVTLPTAESEKAKADYAMLKTAAGKDFDKAYCDMMVNGHKEAVALFEKTNQETKDASVKAMTAAMIPKLKVHLQHSEMCQKECQKM